MLKRLAVAAIFLVATGSAAAGWAAKDRLGSEAEGVVVDPAPIVAEAQVNRLLYPLLASK
jgi:hypothetical protein